MKIFLWFKFFDPDSWTGSRPVGLVMMLFTCFSNDLRKNLRWFYCSLLCVLPVKWPSVPLSQPDPEPVLPPPPAPGPEKRCGNFCCRTYIPVFFLKDVIKGQNRQSDLKSCEVFCVRSVIVWCVIWLVVFNLTPHTQSFTDRQSKTINKPSNLPLRKSLDTVISLLTPTDSLKHIKFSLRQQIHRMYWSGL